MAHGSSKRQAYIVNMKVHDGTKGVKMEKLNTCKKEPEEIIEMLVSHLMP